MNPRERVRKAILDKGARTVRSGLLLNAIVAGWFRLPQHAGAVSPTPIEMADARQWAAAKFADEGKTGIAETFFSFTYDGKPSAGFLGTWDLKRAVRPLDAQRTEHSLTYFDPKTGLLIRCVGVENDAFPAVEWTLYFKNTSGKGTPILSDIQAVDAILARRIRATFCCITSEETVARGTALSRFEQCWYRESTADLSLWGADRRTASGPTMILSGTVPAILAIGWPGQWACRFTRDRGPGVRIRAGQELTHFTLRPGEEVRTPLITVMFYRRDWILRRTCGGDGCSLKTSPRSTGSRCSAKFAESLW